MQSNLVKTPIRSWLVVPFTLCRPLVLSPEKSFLSPSILRFGLARLAPVSRSSSSTYTQRVSQS